VGLSWARAPDTTNCDDKSESRCVIYWSIKEPVIPVGQSDAVDAEKYRCYRYLPNTPTIEDGCMVKKGKFGYEKCGKLKKEEQCGNEALCEWNTTKKNKCTHVCDGKKKKSDCKKSTFKGKNICKFQK